MSTAIRPTVRCTFDEEQDALRLTLKEPVLDEQGNPVAGQLQVVVYALKVRLPAVAPLV